MKRSRRIALPVAAPPRRRSGTLPPAAPATDDNLADLGPLFAAWPAAVSRTARRAGRLCGAAGRARPVRPLPAINLACARWPAAGSMPETLCGTLRRLTFRNDATGYTVAQVAPDEGAAVTVVGVMPPLAAGEAVELLGDWMDHPRYGRQLKVIQVRPMAPTSLAGLAHYLGSGLVPGVGPAIAARIVAHFGPATAHVLDHAPARLREVAGVGAVRAAALVQAWQSQQAARAALIWLQGYGISPRLAAKIYATYGAQTIAQVQVAPYRLERDIPGVGFQTADRIAQALGVPPDAPQRVAAGLAYVLELAARAGHVYQPGGELAARAAQELRVDASLAAEMLTPRLPAGDGLVAEDIAAVNLMQEPEHAVYLARFHRAEVGLAAGRRRSPGAVPHPRLASPAPGVGRRTGWSGPYRAPGGRGGGGLHPAAERPDRRPRHGQDRHPGAR